MRRFSSSQALIAPGTVTEWAEVLTIALSPAARSASGVAAAGARPGTVQRHHLRRPGRHVQAEAIPADPGRVRFDHALHRAGGNGGIERIAARAQDIERGKCGLRHGGGGHAVHAIGGAAARQVEIAHLGSGSLGVALCMQRDGRLGKPATDPWRRRGRGSHGLAHGGFLIYAQPMQTADDHRGCRSRAAPASAPGTRLARARSPPGRGQADAAPAPSGSFVIATATDATMEELAIGLCRSLGPAARDLRVIDIGMSATARAWFAGQGVPVIDPPGAARPAQALDRSYFAAMYLRPHLPRILGGRLILWIDADCWVQDAGAIDDFRRAAMAAPAGIAACAMIDPDYDGCITNLVADQDWYRGLHRPLFGEDGAAFLYGRAVLSSGVFCARADAPFWSAWEAQVRRIYDEVRPAGDIGHMAEQCAFNMVLHQAGGFGLLRSENNWHCHGATMERRDAQVVVARSGARAAHRAPVGLPRHGGRLPGAAPALLNRHRPTPRPSPMPRRRTSPRCWMKSPRCAVPMPCTSWNSPAFAPTCPTARRRSPRCAARSKTGTPRSPRRCRAQPAAAGSPRRCRAQPAAGRGRGLARFPLVAGHRPAARPAPAPRPAVTPRRRALPPARNRLACRR